MDQPQSTPSLRTCALCGQTYPRTPEFWHRDTRTPDGFQTRCRACRNQQQRTAYLRSPIKDHSGKYRQRTRLLVLQHYGGDPPVCACCGEHRLAFLAIDHIDGGGKKHRKAIGRNPSSYAMHRWILVQGFPAGFRVLCHNCNLAIGFYGSCPHEAERAASLDAS